jgi:AraC-like DNA-binding protein
MKDDRLEDASWPVQPPVTPQEDDAWDRIADRIAERIAGAPDDRPLLTINQVAERLALSPRTVRDLLYERDGRPPQLKSIVVADGARRIHPADLDAYVESRRC